MKKHTLSFLSAALWAFSLWGLVVQAPLAHAVPGLNLVTRWNGNPPMATTTSAPTAAPQPEFPAKSTACAGGGAGGAIPCEGQSQVAALVGALHLNGCSTYAMTICGDGGTLSGAGTVNVFSWPEYPFDAGGLNLWAQNKQLTESITVSAGTQCQRFAGHAADGMGWIYPAPSGVTVSAGVVSVQLEAACGN